jgi:hypothetical protein
MINLNHFALRQLALHHKEIMMQKLFLIPVVLGLASVTSVAPASAGCVTGAIVGGIAGHMVGHGGIGAAAGCAYGHHRAHERNMDSGRSSVRDGNDRDR